MNKKYVINYPNISLFIKELIEKISIYSLRTDSYSEKFLFLYFFYTNHVNNNLLHYKQLIPTFTGRLNKT